MKEVSNKEILDFLKHMSYDINVRLDKIEAELAENKSQIKHHQVALRNISGAVLFLSKEVQSLTEQEESEMEFEW